MNSSIESIKSKIFERILNRTRYRTLKHSTYSSSYQQNVINFCFTYKIINFTCDGIFLRLIQMKALSSGSFVANVYLFTREHPVYLTHSSVNHS